LQITCGEKYRQDRACIQMNTKVKERNILVVLILTDTMEANKTNYRETFYTTKSDEELQKHVYTLLTVFIARNVLCWPDE